MTSDQSFVDFYSILQVHPQCDLKTLETAYRDLAKTYHPDHSETADVDKFREVLEAYRALKEPVDRTEYDIKYSLQTGFLFEQPAAETESEKIALSDADAHSRTLLYLYKRRREFASDPGVGQYSLRQMLDCSDESFEFHVWYLRGKGFIEYTEEGTLAITVAGIDHVISMSQTHAQQKLRIANSADDRADKDVS